MFLFFFKQKTAYEMRISDWSSDVCSSDLDAMTVIADDAGVHDIAGIMGGEHSGCSETTTDILLEIAWFTPERIALTGQALGLASDARSRFERGVDPAFIDAATAIVTGHILAICGGTPSTVPPAGTPPGETP